MSAMQKIILLITIWIILQIVPGLQIYVILRALIFSIGNTMDTERFQTMIKVQLRKRQDHILNNQKLSLQVDNDFATIFKNSQIIASICILLAILFSPSWKESLFAEESPHNEREIQYAEPRREGYKAIKECTLTNYWN